MTEVTEATPEGAAKTAMVGAILRGEAPPEPAQAAEGDAPPEPVADTPESTAADEPHESQQLSEAEPDADEVSEAAAEDIDEPTYRAKLSVLAKRANRIRDQRDEARGKLEALEQQVSSASERAGALEQLSSMAKTDPRGALATLAEMVGAHPDELLRRVAQQIIEAPLTRGQSQQRPTKPPQAELTPEQIERMLDERLEKRLQEQQQGFAKAQRKQLVDSILSIPQEDTLAARWPAIAAVPPGRLQYEVQQAVEYAAENQPHLLSDAPKFVDLLDKLLREEYTTVATKLTRTSAQAPPPARAKPPSPARAKPTSIDDPTAAAQRAPDELSPDERRRAVAEAMRKALPFLRSEP